MSRIMAALHSAVSTVVEPIVSSVTPLFHRYNFVALTSPNSTVVKRNEYSSSRKEYSVLTSIFGAVIAPGHVLLWS